MQKRVLNQYEEDLKDKITTENLIVRTEVNVPLESGKSRVADVAAYFYEQVQNVISFKWLRIAQIGVTDSKGEPVKREKDAIAEIEKATGIQVEFYDYNTKQKIK